MEATGIVLTSLLAVVLSGFISRVTRLPAPLVQIALGAAIIYWSLTAVVLDPQVFFLLFLPPLLFLDGWRIPKDDLLRDASTVLKLALGFVVFTVLGMASSSRLPTSRRNGLRRGQGTLSVGACLPVGQKAFFGSSPRKYCVSSPSVATRTSTS